jgi:hypothetical protein
VQEQILDREAHIAKEMSHVKVARQTHDTFTQIANQYAPILAAEGVDPIQATQSLFKTVAQLRLGTQTQRAQVIAELINNYDINIGTLDDVLSGSISDDAPTAYDNRGGPPEIDRIIEERLAPITQLLSQEQDRQRQQVYEQAHDVVEQFAETAEFLADVRMDMADIIDAKTRQGVKISLQDAYDAACQLNPEIRSILQQRQQQTLATANQQTLAQKRDASGSLNGKKTGVAVKTQSSGSLRGDIAAAFDAL